METEKGTGLEEHLGWAEVASRRQRQGITEFKANLVYRVNSRTARTTQRNPVSKN